MSFAQEILQLILRHEFLILKSERFQLTRERAGQFYGEHQGLSSLALTLSLLFQSIERRKVLLPSSGSLHDLVSSLFLTLDHVVPVGPSRVTSWPGTRPLNTGDLFSVQRKSRGPSSNTVRPSEVNMV